MKESLLRKTLDNVTVVMVCLSGFKRANFPKEEKKDADDKNGAGQTIHTQPDEKVNTTTSKPSTSKPNTKKSMTVDFDRKHETEGSVPSRTPNKHHRSLHSAALKKKDISRDITDPKNDLSGSFNKTHGLYSRLFK